MKLLINELRSFFKNSGKDLKLFVPRYKQILQKINMDNFKNPVSNGTYKRRILYTDKNFEIVLISWGKYSEAPKHCHPENGCLLAVLEGDLIEERYTHGEELYETNYLNSSKIGYMHCDLGQHRVMNNNDYNTYSLHIYSPPGFYK